MDAGSRIEQALDSALASAHRQNCPPLLAQAMRHAVFPGGARIRPRLTLAVAMACGDTQPSTANAAAAAIEFLHCASLVHDDLPCFDDADIRRGKAAVHKAFGEPLAVLAGDALIVLAFETLGGSRCASAAAAVCPGQSGGRRCRQPGRHCRRPGLGIGDRGRLQPVSPGQDRGSLCRRHHGWRCRSGRRPSWLARSRREAG